MVILRSAVDCFPRMAHGPYQNNLEIEEEKIEIP